MRNGFILVMLCIAMLFSLFATEPQKIDTGQIIKNELVQPAYAMPTINFSEFDLIGTVKQFEPTEKPPNYIISSHPAKVQFERLTFSPKSDYGV